MESEFSKENLIQTVKTWVQLDNQIKQVNKVLKKLRDEKKEQNKTHHIKTQHNKTIQ